MEQETRTMELEEEEKYRFECRFCTNGTDNEDEDCGCQHENKDED